MNLFDYIDYRKYLLDYYSAKKEQSPYFSYRSFAKKAGFASVSYLHHVINGKRRISNNSLEGFCRALGLSQTEKDYFENLVRFNQTDRPETKKYYYEQLLPIHKKEVGQKLSAKQYEFYANWYAPVILEMVGLKDFNESPKWIARRLKNLITPSQAKKTLALLEGLGLVERDPSGKLKTTNKNLTTPAEVEEVAVGRFHQEMLERARHALENDGRDEREVSCITTRLSKKQFGELKTLIQQFQNKVLFDLENAGEVADEVYQFNFQLFPLTKKREDAHGNKD